VLILSVSVIGRYSNFSPLYFNKAPWLTDPSGAVIAMIAKFLLSKLFISAAAVDPSGTVIPPAFAKETARLDNHKSKLL
jgi:hypothetical protein